MPDPLTSLLLLSLSLRAPAYVLLPSALQVVVVPFVRAIHNQIYLWTHFIFQFLLARFKRLVPSAPSAPIDTPQAPVLGMGLGIASTVVGTDPGFPVPISDTLPLNQVGEVMDSPTEELPGAPLDALLSGAPNVPKIPDLPVKPPVPDTGSLPISGDVLMKLLADKDSVVSALTKEALAAASQDDPVDPHALIARLVQVKAANERTESLVGSTPAPVQGAAGALPVRRQVPDPTTLLSTLKEMVESGQFDHELGVEKPSGARFTIFSLSLCHSYLVLFAPPAPDQLAPPNSPLAYALDVAPTLPVAGPPDSTPADMLDVSAIPFPPPTSPAVVASSVPIAHDDPTMIPSAVSLPIPLAAPAPGLDAPFSLENDSGEPFAAAMLAPSWVWNEATDVESPVPGVPSPPTPPLIGARDFKPTVPTGKLSNKELPPMLAPPKEKRTSRLRFGAGR